MSVQTIKTIDAIRFSVWSPTEIRKYSVAEITAPETYDEDGMSVQEFFFVIQLNMLLVYF